MIDLQGIARTYGGEVKGGQALIPAIGHSSADRGVAIKADANAPDGVLVHCFNGDASDAIAEKDRLRADGFLPEYEGRKKPERGLTKVNSSKAISGFWILPDGTDVRDLPVDDGRPEETFVPATSWDYYDEDGVWLYRKERFEKPGGKKSFVFKQPDGSPGKGDAPHVLYRLPELLQSKCDVYLAEGEKCADRLLHWRFESTSLKDLDKCDLTALEGRRCIILPDNDKQGEKEAEKARAALEGVALEIITVELPGLPEKGDIEDWTGSRKEFERIVSRSIKASKDGQFKFRRAGQMEYRAPEFLIDDLVETESMGLIFGDPGCGKSFMAVDIALSIATGASFHGKHTKQGPVFYIAGEGFNGLARRFAAWSKDRGVSIEDAPLFVSERPAQFLDEKSAQSVADAVHKLAERFGTPAMIQVDTLARNFGPGDENSTSEMGQFIAAMDDLKAQFKGCSIMIIHHTGHGDKQRARGAMALKGALDCEYRINKSGNVVSFINTKMKDAEPPAPIYFELSSVHLDMGASSAVLKQTEKSEEESNYTDAQNFAIKTFVEASAQDECWVDGCFIGVHLDCWRESFYKSHHGDSDAAKRQAFLRARNSLMDRSTFKVSDDVYTTEDDSILMAVKFKKGER